MPWGDDPLRCRKAISRLLREGAVYHGRYLLLIIRHVEEGSRRVLFIASRRVGKAVRRNRAKRLMRSGHQRLSVRMADQPLDIAWIARPSCAEARIVEVWTDMEGLLARAGLLKRDHHQAAIVDPSVDGRTLTR